MSAIGSDCSLLLQANEFKTVNSAFRSLEFSDKAIESIWKLVAVILHLGNLAFTESEAANGQNGRVSQSLAPNIPYFQLGIMAE